MAKPSWTPWHQVVTLRDDLKTGQLALNEFAADLYDVALQRGTRPTYENPKSFFALTYPTTALRGTLSKTTASLPKPDEARVNGGRKVDSCGGRKSDSRQHGLAAG